jgi:hypothetical protein
MKKKYDTHYDHFRFLILTLRFDNIGNHSTVWCHSIPSVDILYQFSGSIHETYCTFSIKTSTGSIINTVISIGAPVVSETFGAGKPQNTPSISSRIAEKSAPFP